MWVTGLRAVLQRRYQGRFRCILSKFRYLSLCWNLRALPLSQNWKSTIVIMMLLHKHYDVIIKSILCDCWHDNWSHLGVYVFESLFILCAANPNPLWVIYHHNEFTFNSITWGILLALEMWLRWRPMPYCPVAIFKWRTSRQRWSRVVVWWVIWRRKSSRLIIWVLKKNCVITAKALFATF